MLPMSSFPFGEIQRDKKQYQEKKILANHGRLLFLLYELILSHSGLWRRDGRDSWV